MFQTIQTIAARRRPPARRLEEAPLQQSGFMGENGRQSVLARRRGEPEDFHEEAPLCHGIAPAVFGTVLA